MKLILRKALLVLNAVSLIVLPGSNSLPAWAAVAQVQAVPAALAPGGIGSVGAAPGVRLGPSNLQLDMRLGGISLPAAKSAPESLPAAASVPIVYPSAVSPAVAQAVKPAPAAAPVSIVYPSAVSPAVAQAVKPAPAAKSAPAAAAVSQQSSLPLPKPLPRSVLPASPLGRIARQAEKRQAIPKLDLAAFTPEGLRSMPAAGARAAGDQLMDQILRLRGAGAGDVQAEPHGIPSSEGLSSPLLETAPAERPSRRADEVPAARTAAPAPASWDVWTTRLVLSAGFVFSLLLVPQIAKNFINLGAGELQALAALPWMGFATNVLANSLYLGHFREKKEYSRTLIQLIGVLSGTVVLGQIVLAGFMPLSAFAAVSALVGVDLGLNFLAYKGKLSGRIWKAWSEATGLLGLALIPQALWSTFAPAAMASMVPLAVSALATLALYALKRAGMLPARVDKAWDALAGLTGTLLFMFGPVAALVAMALHPADIAGIALGSVLLGLTGDLLLSPRLMLTKDYMGLSSNLWSILLAGVARLVWMYALGFVPALLFWPAIALVPAYFGFAAVMGRRHPLERQGKVRP